MIPHSAHNDGVFDFIVSKDVAAAGVVASPLHEGAAAGVDANDPGREAALQQLRLSTAHLARQLHLRQQPVGRGRCTG
jgi:hypothetical protein